jgi:transcriptional regulator with XRE-family HTH domain
MDQERRTLRHLREAKGLSQDKLSELTGVAWATIAKLELGDHSPNLDTLRRLSKVLGYEVLDVDYGWRRPAKKQGQPRTKNAKPTTDPV